MNEVNAPRARLVLAMGDRLRAGMPSRYVGLTSQLGHLSLASLRGRLIDRVPASARVKAGMSLCRVAGNTVRSYMACEFQ